MSTRSDHTNGKLYAEVVVKASLDWDETIKASNVAYQNQTAAEGRMTIAKEKFFKYMNERNQSRMAFVVDGYVMIATTRKEGISRPQNLEIEVVPISGNLP